MGNGDTVHSRIVNVSSTAVLLSVAVTSAAQVLIESEAGLSTETLMQSVIQIGGPTALGALAANVIVPVKVASDLKYTKLAMRGALAGGVACGVLVLSGGLPMQVDAQLLSLAAVVGGAVAASTVLAYDWGQIFPPQ